MSNWKSPPWAWPRPWDVEGQVTNKQKQTNNLEYGRVLGQVVVDDLSSRLGPRQREVDDGGEDSLSVAGECVAA